MDLRPRNPSNPAADTQKFQRREEAQVTPNEAAQRKALNRLPLVWDSGWTPRRMQEYAAATNDINPDDLDNAITHLIRTSKFRPTPADIREAANPAKETTTVGRQIELDPEYQTPGPDGIRPFIHAAIQRVQRIGGPDARTYLHDLTTNRTKLNDAEHDAVNKAQEKC
jgi:hypothetical protein